jgi:peptidoglycan/LPS O-acetylase OafA/YrhL
VDVALVLLGAIFVTYGWYWGGITESRTTAYALGAASFMFGFWFAFSGGAGGDAVAGSMIGFSAIFGLLAAANAWNESSQDRTYGMFALLFGIVAIFGYFYFADQGAPSQYGYGALIAGVVLLLHFISAALVHANRGFKSFVGWMTLIAGAVLVFFGFAVALGVDFGTL